MYIILLYYINYYTLWYYQQQQGTNKVLRITIEQMNVSDWPVIQAQKQQNDEVYFQGNKRTELNDMKLALSTIISDPDKCSLRIQIIKKVVSYTTAGVDTSRFYPEMVLASATNNLIEKKLIFVYLSVYSKKNDNFARMAINTFIKDSSSNDPYIRSLAIRHLSNLRFKGREIYVLPILTQGLKDHSSLVKKTCVMGMVKLWAEGEQPHQDIMNVFYDLIRNSDRSLVCSVLAAIHQGEAQGIAMSKKLTMYLVSQLNTFNQLQLPIILTFICMYEIKTQEDINVLYNALKPKLKSCCVPVNIAASKVLLKIVDARRQLTQTIIPQVFKSLLSFINHDIPEMGFVVLTHLLALIQYQRDHTLDYFSEHFKKFMLGGEQEQTYIKIQKIHILQLCINKNNIADIINEFAQYLLCESLCKQTIESLSKTVLQVTEADSKFILKTVIKTIESTGSQMVCNNALPLILNYLRSYPQEFPLFSGVFYDLVRSAKEEYARCCLLEIIGDYGEYIEDAVELVAWSDNLGGSQDTSVQLSLLRANMKLFLKRPSQMLNILVNMFEYIFTEDSIRCEIKDYAALLYKAFRQPDFGKAYLQHRRHQPKPNLNKIFYQFNTLQVIYKAKEVKWLLSPQKYVQVEDQPQDQQETEAETVESLDRNTTNINVDSKFKQLQYTNIDQSFILSEEEFEKAFQNYQIGSSITRLLKNIEQLCEDNLEELFKTWLISVIATSEDQNQIKLYAYCRIIQQQKQLGIACMELCILKDGATLTLLIKCQDEQLAIFVSKYIEQFLRLNSII